MDDNIVSMCLQFSIILPSSLNLSSGGLESKASPISVVSALCLTASTVDSSKIAKKSWIIIKI